MTGNFTKTCSYKIRMENNFNRRGAFDEVQDWLRVQNDLMEDDTSATLSAGSDLGF